MAFVAEYISKEDLKQYDILSNMNELLMKHNYTYPIQDNDTDWMNWVIDRQRDAWLIHVCLASMPDPRDGYKGEDIWLLHYKDKNIELDIRRIYDETTSKMLVDNPFFIKYKLENINSSIDGIPLDELYKILKEALTEYGNRGIRGRENLPKEHEVVTFLHD
ncbi:hypothetical protein [uncultured Campylobacter sp.]|uniref:hypothetical protein n=1 Tax=uncultured Campylobacter sp. TaxID=218934 RepID=UPI002601A549|nr:hypothetical protein [uncultured Campylobacter sp.]